jgi:hypothetical protein
MVVTAEPYVIADISVRLGNLQLHEVSRSKLGEHVHAIAQVEGPVHVQQVMRRICDAAGVGRLGSRIESAISAGVDYARQQGWVKVRGEFLWPPEDGKVAIRDRSNLEAAERKIELIAPEEVKAAIAAIVEGSFGIDEEEVAPAVARLLGFARTSEEIAAGIRKHLKAMIRKSDVESNDGHITLPRS